ncbi:3-oxoacyl-[acyl-carrier protein] reductase [Blastochloris viridis]|nr:3-oxoacyl-[acyl-carrier protein] reductase [Blastochloris viridis]
MVAVTGATGPIGAEICRALARTIPVVVGLYRSRHDRADALGAEIAAAGGDFRPLRCDLLEPDGPQRAVRDLKATAGAPTVVVLAAGAKVRGPALTARPDAVGPLLHLNVAAQIEFARLTLKDMIKARHGRIVVIGSRAGQAGLPGQAAYAASKAALAAWAASLAGEVGGFGITVNVVSPGAMEDRDSYSAEEQHRVVERIGCARLGTPRDVAAAVAFLASAEAAYINGTTLAVDGGARF